MLGMSVVNAREEIERGWEAYARRAWAEAYESLSHADQTAELGVEDVELLATSASMIGCIDEYLGLLERVHHASLDTGDGLRAARAGFWIGMNLAVRGDMRAQHESANGTRSAERVETVIIGGGQAGLALGYHLMTRNRPFVILDANERIGDSWRARWDSLRLFTPARYDGLPGLRFPAPSWSFPTKDEMGDYLEAYATRFGFHVRTGVSVDCVSRVGDRYLVESASDRFEADNVVVASGAHRTPKVPSFARELDPRVVQMHSSEYKNPAQLRDGDVLVVGVGNSGAEIALELSRTHASWLSGKQSGEIPVRHGSFPFRLVVRVIRFLGYRVLTMKTPVGRKLGPKIVSEATPLIRVKSKHLAAAGVERVPRVAGVRGGLPLLEDGRVLDVANVICHPRRGQGR
jgi:putative flavoprotein involved in K+ transport